jgi:hypothetical protein
LKAQGNTYIGQVKHLESLPTWRQGQVIEPHGWVNHRNRLRMIVGLSLPPAFRHVSLFALPFG